MFATTPDSLEQIAASDILKKSFGDTWNGPEEDEGQLSVDIIHTPDELVIIAPMAGTRPEDVELHLHNDFLTIRGRRESPAPVNAEYFVQENFWGVFSRTIVLPVDVKGELARSEYRSGVLTVRLPKSHPATGIPIMVIEE